MQPTRMTTDPTKPANDATRHEERAPASEAPPMTASLMARLFVVPAILVSVLVVALMTVVILFGWSGIGERVTAVKLIDRIAGATGDKNQGALFPENKDVWLAAQELAERLKNRDREMKPDEIELAVQRLGAICSELARQENLTEAARRKSVFVMLALGRMGSGSGVAPLIAALSAKDAQLRMAALRGLVELRDLPETQSAMPAVITAMDDASPEVRLMACAAAGQIAVRGDAGAVRALTDKLHEDRETRWNAALALARLGSLAAKDELQTMLDRGYWEQARVVYEAESATTGDSTIAPSVAPTTRVERPFSETQISTIMLAAIDAAVELGDAELMNDVARLRSDASPIVRDRAIKAVRRAQDSADE
ncbi:MAG: HEAT repeat domain-containing protein [Phycisphaerae bacterium]|nr:HEAT repeat domain-containing protein [Phycisphaerae bacterium]